MSTLGLCQKGLGGLPRLDERHLVEERATFAESTSDGYVSCGGQIGYGDWHPQFKWVCDGSTVPGITGFPDGPGARRRSGLSRPSLLLGSWTPFTLGFLYPYLANYRVVVFRPSLTLEFEFEA